MKTRHMRPVPSPRALVALLATAAGALGAAPANAAVVDCHTFAHYPNVLISSARNMSCGQAAQDMRRYRQPIYRRFRTPGGFSCVRVSGMELGGQWRCTNRNRAYRFDFGD